jgi:hypothetical protein
VPREGRILRDAQGQLVFIGDCSPLSFLQTVRHLIASEVDAEGFAVQASRESVIEVANEVPIDPQKTFPVLVHEVQSLVDKYIVVTSGLVELFERGSLIQGISTWARDISSFPDTTKSAVYFLILAIGAQECEEYDSISKAHAWFKHARDILQKHMCSSMNVSTVQGFVLVAIFMLRSFQPNGAYLYFCEQFP